jgi:predicted AlkP superfamily pyrophosphatase or phosphodiesterase
MRYFLIGCCAFLFLGNLQAQKKSRAASQASPKLVVGMMVDQMRWDFLYRYRHRFSEKGGLQRILKQGFLNEQTMIPYAPTVTACGHASVYTGTVPALHGIVGNNWWSREFTRAVYCTEDRSYQTVGSSTAAGEMSPKNMFANTICDELKLATQFRSKVIGIAIKDRGAILPAGHAADAAYWYDPKSGNWVSSTYYQNTLPGWVQNFNAQKHPDKFYQRGWQTLFPSDSYHQSDSDENDYESTPFGQDQKNFPYNLSGFAGKNYGVISQTPYGNTMTFMMAQQAIENEAMGQDSIPDFLAVSFSSTDYIGHAFGPNSIETEDTYLRLDRELGEFLDFLDQKVGKNQYLFFLTADHGVAHVPGFLEKHKMPAGAINDEGMIKELNELIQKQFGLSGLIVSALNYQLTLNHSILDSSAVDQKALFRFIQEYVQKQPGIDRVFPLENMSKELLPGLVRERIINGYHPGRSGDLQVLFLPNWIDGGKKGTTHGLWNPYDSHIPLIWYGWNILKGRSSAPVSMSDIAPTIAALLHIQMPNACIGKPILSVLAEE